MSQPDKRSKKSTKVAAPNAAVRDWIIRGIVFGVLGNFLVLALLNFRVRQQASSTAEAWRFALRAKGEDGDLTRSELRKIPINGSPEIASVKSEVRSMDANLVDTYTWKGTLQTFKVKVSFGLGEDPAVEQIEGP
jgi:hypothetical protein